MIDLPGVSSLEVVAERLSGLGSFLFQRGDPARLAGDPGGIRRLAEHHRDSAGRLGAVTAVGRDRVSRVLAGSWQGEASARFAGYWSDLERRLGALAAAHQEMADRLEQVADDSARLNREVTALLGITEGWLSSARAALASRDLGAAGGVAGEGMTLVVRWERLLRDVEVFAEGIGRRLSARFGFARRPVLMSRRPPQRQPRIDLPVLYPGPYLGAPLPGRDGSPMADRRRVDPGGRQGPLPPPHSGRRRGQAPPGADPWPERRRPRMPGQRRRPEGPPSEPLPPARSGVDSQPRKERRDRLPGRAGAPIRIPTSGPPFHAPPVPHHRPAMAPSPTPVDAYILQLATIGALAGPQAKKLIQQVQRGKNSGDKGSVGRARKK